MKIYSTRFLARLLLSTMIILPLTISSASALTKRSIIKITLDQQTSSSEPASKLEIIAAVKAKYTGKIDRIISVRKKSQSYGKNCHSVKILDNTGEFIEIRVACNK